MHFTSQIAGLEELDYWDRLTKLRMYSQERRRERYRIIFIWKVLQGYVQGYNKPSKHSPRCGRLVEVAQYQRDAPGAVKQAREASISVHGSKLFNLLPRHIRDISCGTTDQFKAELDSWLGLIPDQPSIPGRQRNSKTRYLCSSISFMSDSWSSNSIWVDGNAGKPTL